MQELTETGQRWERDSEDRLQRQRGRDGHGN